jgi:Secretion system C-terminal sorting domain
VLDSQVFKTNTINFHPNLTTNILTINNKSNMLINSILISDTYGINVLEAKNVSSTIDISDLSKGICFVRLATDAGSITKKLVKE